MKLYLGVGLLAMNLVGATSAMAQKEGHGGNVMACFSSNAIADRVRSTIIENEKNGTRKDPLAGVSDADIKSVELLEFSMADQKAPASSAQPVVLIDPAGVDFTQILKDQLAKIQSANLSYYIDVMQSSKVIDPADDDAWKGSESGVDTLHDARFVENDPNSSCLMMQVANQQIMSKQVAIVLYNSRLFRRLKPRSQAGLVWHEWTYNALVREIAAKDSLGVQLLTRGMFRADFDSRIEKFNSQYFGLVDPAFNSTYHYRRVTTAVNLSIDSNVGILNLKAGTYLDFELDRDSNRPRITKFFLEYESLKVAPDLKCSQVFSVSSWANSKIILKSCDAVSGTFQGLNATRGTLGDQNVSFYPNGEIDGLVVSLESSVEFQGVRLSRGYAHLEFDPKGKLIHYW